jgi:nitrogen fixation/metabolism regulation signal transduction histidine kinase
MSEAPKTPPAAPPYRRSARNYLIDRNFQLKYAGFLAGTTLLVSVALGFLIFRESSEAITQGQRTVERGQLVITQSRNLSKVVSMQIEGCYKDSPELAKSFGQAADEDDQKLKSEQQQLERDAAYLAKRSRTLLVALILTFAVLVIGVGLLGIVFTHKVAGPVFKMKRLLREVGEGKLVVRERLRKGDELHHFFESFEQMVEALRRRQQAEIARVDGILEKLSDAPLSTRGLKEFDEDGIEMLRKLRAEMQDQLDA